MRGEGYNRPKATFASGMSWCWSSPWNTLLVRQSALTFSRWWHWRRGVWEYYRVATLPPKVTKCPIFSASVRRAHVPWEESVYRCNPLPSVRQQAGRTCDVIKYFILAKLLHGARHKTIFGGFRPFWPWGTCQVWVKRFGYMMSIPCQFWELIDIDDGLLVIF